MPLPTYTVRTQQRLIFEDLVSTLPPTTPHLLPWDELLGQQDKATITPRISPALLKALKDEAVLLGISENQLYNLKLNLALSISVLQPSG